MQDKTFGLKNKKGSKQQKFIQQVQHQVTQGGKSAKQVLIITMGTCALTGTRIILRTVSN